MTLTRPRGTSPAPARLVKGLVDGVVAAFETHSGPPEKLDLVVSRLAASLGEPPETIRRWLTGRDLAVLSDRALIRPTRTHVAWNPGDDRCLAGEVLLDPEPGERALSG